MRHPIGMLEKPLKKLGFRSIRLKRVSALNYGVSSQHLLKHAEFTDRAGSV